jgi:protein TonB
MQTNKILSAKLIDLIFDGRNKDYGAYELRNTYSRRIKKAMLVTFSVAAVAIGGVAFANSFKKHETRYKINDVVMLTDVEDIKKPEPIPEPERRQEEPQVQTQKLTLPEIVPDEEVTEPLPSQDDLIDAKIDSKTTEGIPDDGTVKGPQAIGDTKGIIENKVDKESDEPRMIVEVQASFVGDWKKFLLKNLNPDVPVNNSAPAGSYTILIQFVVDKEGNVSDIKPLTSHGYGMEEEAVRVLKKATKWEPAIQNGYPVKAYRRQAITFMVMEE